ncbi:MAG: AAA family ATPase [Candidatus Micrarchaeia archaeon]|jgi:cell division control protein 6
MPSFSDLLKKKTIFRNKDALLPHFVPEQLLFREDEITRIMTAVLPALQGRKARNVFIYGSTGTGKTASVRTVMKKLSEEAGMSVSPIYMNCRVYDSRYKVMQKCISDFRPDFAKTGFSFSVLYERLLDWIEGGDSGSNARHLIVALDEIDMVKDLDSLVYTLSRANDDLKHGSVSMIGISNKIDFKNRLGSRSKSSLCEEEIVFSPYNAHQLRDILKTRASAAFEEPAIVEDSGLSLAAAIAAAENGDARYALSLLLRASELAEKRGTKVSDRDVEEARKAADEDKAFEVISTLPEQQQLLLLALAGLSMDSHYRKLVEEDGERYYFSGEVYERYASLARGTGKDPRTARWYREYLADLENLGLIVTLHSGKGVRGQTTLVKLAFEPAKIKKIIEKKLSDSTHEQAQGEQTKF